MDQIENSTFDFDIHNADVSQEIFTTFAITVRNIKAWFTTSYLKNK